MHKETKQIAIYGKGGIGKSTIAANISAALASAGKKVLQVGCDPKQDSTRLLLGGNRIATVLDYLKASTPDTLKLEEIVHIGFAGVCCVEAGGPEPGIGCAGRGILSAFDLLKQLGIDDCGYDIALYDVLGDVVCGGFAVPLRKEYSQLVYIVTSGEFMSLYAGNNILRGVLNYEGSGKRLGGIIFNQRGLDREGQRVKRFAEAVRLPIVAGFPRSDLIAEAECQGQTIMEAFPETELAKSFQLLAEYISGDPPRMAAHPLTPDELEEVIFGRRPGGVVSSAGTTSTSVHIETAPSAVPSSFIAPPRRYCSKSVQNHGVLHGCAFNGASHTVLQIRDAVTVAHGPESCAYLTSRGITSSARRTYERRGMRLGHGLAPALRCSEMDERIVIFGGNDELTAVLRRVVKERPAAIFIVTACSSGIIGDNAGLSISKIQGQTGAAPMILIESDGDITGDYTQGIIDAMIAVAKGIIDPGIPPEDDMVNIVAEKNLANNTEHNFRTVCELLDAMELRLNCRFIRDCTTEQLAGFMRARLNLPAYDDSYARIVRDFLVNTFNAPFLSSPFPVGFHATSDWLRNIGAHFGKSDAAERIIAHHSESYKEAISAIRPALSGKRILVSGQDYRLDWVLEAASDAGMEIVKVGIQDSPWYDAFMSRFEGLAPIERSYTRERMEEDMRELAPDLTLLSHPWFGMPEGFRFDIVPMCPDVGFYSGVQMVKRWQRLMRLPAKEGWRNDI